jgi:hypothetical protein
LAAAQLQVLALSRQMQLLHRQQTSLLQLLQQQGQLEPQQTAASAAAGSSSSSSYAAEEPANSTAPSDSWTVLLNLHVTMPCQPTDRLLDCVHLFLVVSPSSSDQLSQAAAGAAASAGAEDLPAAAAAGEPLGVAGVVADVPLLVLPAAAQQEVQQLLLPAMRQEVQAAQQQEQLQQQHDLDQPTAEDFARMSMAVEHGAWQHYHQMANDVYAVVQLSAAAAAEAAAAQAAAGVLHDAHDNAEAVGGAVQGPAAAGAGVVVVPHNNGEAEEPAAAKATAAVAQPASSAAALQHLADVLLFPLLLPFLATQGLHNMLRLLLMCLPQQLQHQWQQQQFARLQHLVAAAPAPLQLPAMLDEQLQQQQQGHAGDVEGGAQPERGPAAAAGLAAAPAADAEPAQIQQQARQQQQQASLPSSSPAGGEVASQTSSSTAVPEEREQNEKSEKSEKHISDEASNAPTGKQKGATPTAAAAGSAASDAEGAAVAAAHAAAAAEAAVAGVPWYLPFTQFANGDFEQRCVTGSGRIWWCATVGLQRQHVSSLSSCSLATWLHLYLRSVRLGACGTVHVAVLVTCCGLCVLLLPFEVPCLVVLLSNTAVCLTTAPTGTAPRRTAVHSQPATGASTVRLFVRLCLVFLYLSTAVNTSFSCTTACCRLTTSQLSLRCCTWQCCQCCRALLFLQTFLHPCTAPCCRYLLWKHHSLLQVDYLAAVLYLAVLFSNPSLLTNLHASLHPCSAACCRYLSWKHHSLLQVDYLAALFEVLYLAVLLRRMMTEPITVFYFLFVLFKTLPHVPLMMGLRYPYLR